MRARHPRRHHLTRHYGRENPLSEGAMVGIALGAIALTGGIAYLMLRKPATTTTPTPSSGSAYSGSSQSVSVSPPDGGSEVIGSGESWS